jgi:peptide/nickel transport system substrate-binding protein
VAYGQHLTSAPLAVVMPERVVKTDPYKQISDYVGNGPMRFAAGERISGARRPARRAGIVACRRQEDSLVDAQ